MASSYNPNTLRMSSRRSLGRAIDKVARRQKRYSPTDCLHRTQHALLDSMIAKFRSSLDKVPDSEEGWHSPPSEVQRLRWHRRLANLEEDLKQIESFLSLATENQTLGELIEARPDGGLDDCRVPQPPA